MDFSTSILLTPPLQAPLQGNGYGGYPVGMRGGPRRGGAPPGRDKVNYDTFFTMKRLLERSRTPEELLRWLVQNPTKVSPSHYPVALQRLAQLLQQQHQGMAKEVGNKKAEDDRSSLTTNGQELQMLYQGIIKHCPQFDNYGVVNCLYALAAMGEHLISAYSTSLYLMWWLLGSLQRICFLNEFFMKFCDASDYMREVVTFSQSL